MNLRGKLITAFLLVSLIPLCSMAVWDYFLSRSVLEEKLNQALYAAVSQTAEAVDAFITYGLDNIRTESLLPEFASYLSQVEMHELKLQKRAEIESILFSLKKRDQVNISSYALLDKKGMVVADTYGPDFYIDKSDREYFNYPMATGLPYVSHVFFSPATGKPSIFFSSPVRDSFGKILGVLRVRYDSSVIQQVVIKNAGKLGSDSGILIFDENYVRIADSMQVKYLFNPLMRMEKVESDRYEEFYRVPKGFGYQQTELSALASGVRAVEANASRFFSASLHKEGSEMQCAAVKTRIVPWYVLFAQPRDMYFAPLKKQLYHVFFLGTTFVLLVLIAGIWQAGRISNPIVELKNTAERIAGGDLSVRAKRYAGDEIGVLSDSFNTMAESLWGAFESLNRRVDDLNDAQKRLRGYSEDLEKEIAERMAAERMLKEKTVSLESEITERIRTQDALDKIRGYLDNVINSMPSVIVGIDETGIITQWNAEAVKSTGKSKTEVIGKSFASVFPKLNLEIEKARVELNSSTPRKLVKIPRVLNGSVRYADIVVYPLVANGVKGAVIRVDDVTERVRVEELMIQTEKMMSIGGLAAGMAHEINNPLGAIVQTVQNIERRVSKVLARNYEVARECGVELERVIEYLEKREVLKFLDGVRKSGQRAATIVGDMLQFSRKSESRKTVITLSSLLDKTIEMASSDYDLKKKYDFRHILINREYDHNIREVRCTETEMEQVILNLLRNAAQAMNEKVYSEEEKPRITIRTRKEGSMVRIEVEDNGPGMDEETRRRAFEPFFTTKPAGIGTGLGLSVSYFIIVGNHKGEFYVESKPGLGSRFVIRLPEATV